MNSYIHLHSQVHFIMGYARTLLYDAPRSKHRFIPNTLVHCVNNSHGSATKLFVQRCEAYGLDGNRVLQELIEEEVLFAAPWNFAERFPPIEPIFKNPWWIHTASIVLSDKIVEHLNHLSRIRIRCLKLICIDDLTPLLGARDLLVDMSLSYLSITIPNQDYASKLNDLLRGHSLCERVSEKITCNTLPEKDVIKDGHGPNLISGVPGSGKHKNRIVFSLDIFRESFKYNTFYNGRIHITSNGIVRYNDQTSDDLCDLGRLDFIAKHPVDQLMVRQTFPVWFSRKEATDVCNQCELRQVCLDSREPLQRPDSHWYHTVECNYNPYICKWKDEEGYRTLAECGVVSNAEGFSIDHDRIAAINAELWGE